MAHHRLYETATSMHLFKQHFQDDLRYYAPSSDVRVFKIIGGKETLVNIEPPLTFEKALEITSELRHRNNGAKGV